MDNTAKSFATKFRENKSINNFIFHDLKYKYSKVDCLISIKNLIQKTSEDE